MHFKMEYSCICGACTVTSNHKPMAVYCCHCSDCQKSSGTDYQVNARFKPGQLKINAPEGGLRNFRKEESLAERVYCRTCQVRVYVDRWGQDGSLALQVVPVGLLTGGREDHQPPEWRPTDHAWYGERARDVFDDLPKWAKFKGSEELRVPKAAPSDAKRSASLPLPAPPQDLSCHCGATTARCTEAPLSTYYCHCSSCQQLPGGAFCHNARFNPSQPEMLSGEDGLVHYQKPGSCIRTYRCGTCFTRIFREWLQDDGKPAVRIVPAGIVDRAALNDPAWHPRFHMYWSERSIPSLPDGLPKWSTKPNQSDLCKDED